MFCSDHENLTLRVTSVSLLFIYFLVHFQSSKVASSLPSPHPGALSPLMMYNSEHLAQPPPAHMGIPPVHIDPKTGKVQL